MGRKILCFDLDASSYFRREGGHSIRTFCWAVAAFENFKELLNEIERQRVDRVVRRSAELLRRRLPILWIESFRQLLLSKGLEKCLQRIYRILRSGQGLYLSHGVALSGLFWLLHNSGKVTEQISPRCCLWMSWGGGGRSSSKDHHLYYHYYLYCWPSWCEQSCLFSGNNKAWPATPLSTLAQKVPSSPAS